MEIIETLPKNFFDLFPNQTFILSGGDGGSFFVLRGIYSDEEFGLSNTLDTKTISQIFQEAKEMASNVVDNIGSKTINAITKIVGAIKDVSDGASFISSGGRTDIAPWTTWKKVVSHNHGIITLNFIITENIKKSTEILNKISLQSISKNGFWEYEYTDTLSEFLKGTSSLSASKKTNSAAGKIDSKIMQTIGKKLFRLKMGNWFDSGTMLLVQGCDYRIKTGVFDEKGNPEYLEVTLRLMPARKIGANDYNKWFLISN